MNNTFIAFLAMGTFFVLDSQQKSNILQAPVPYLVFITVVSGSGFQRVDPGHSVDHSEMSDHRKSSLGWIFSFAPGHGRQVEEKQRQTKLAPLFPASTSCANNN